MNIVWEATIASSTDIDVDINLENFVKHNEDEILRLVGNEKIVLLKIWDNIALPDDLKNDVKESLKRLMGYPPVSKINS